MIQKHTLSIGGLAQAAGVNVETIRYYQRVGMLAQPAKPLQGVRKYGPRDIKQIRFIKRAQELGFSLDEIVSLLTVNDNPCGKVSELAAQKKQLVSDRIGDLQRLSQSLDHVLSQCDSNQDKSHCPIIDSFLP